jgi:hypothetical protein
MSFVDSPDSQVVDAFEGRAADAADDRGAIAADQRVGDGLLAFRAIEFGSGWRHKLAISV